VEEIGIRAIERRIHKQSYDQGIWIIPEQKNIVLMNLRSSLTELIKIGKRLGEPDF